MPCKGVCDRYRARKRDRVTKSMYQDGVVRCSTCDIFMRWTEKRCPCCAYQVKRKPLAAHTRRANIEKDLVPRIAVNNQ